MLPDRLRQFLGTDQPSVAGKTALGLVAETLAPHPYNRRQIPAINGSVPGFPGLQFWSEGEGVFVDKHGTFHPGYRRPSITIIHPNNGPEVTYQARGWRGRVSCSSDEFPSRPLTPQDAVILEAAARETLVLKARRDQQIEQDELVRGIGQKAFLIDRAITGRVVPPAIVKLALAVPFFNQKNSPFAVISTGHTGRMKPTGFSSVHRFAVVRPVNETAADFFEFAVEKIGVYLDQNGRVDSLKKRIQLPVGDFTQFSREDFMSMFVLGETIPYTAKDLGFLDGVSQRVEYPIRSDEFGVRFPTNRFGESVSKQLEPGLKITAEISRTQGGTKFTISPEKADSPNTDRPANLAEMAKMVEALVGARTKLETQNPWLGPEAALVRCLLAGSQTTIQQLIDRERLELMATEANFTMRLSILTAMQDELRRSLGDPTLRFLLRDH